MSNATETKQFVPEYSRWRHGGWYVTNVSYPSGAVGCVTNNRGDGFWYIECDPTETRFTSRDAAARAEYVATEMVKRER